MALHQQPEPEQRQPFLPSLVPLPQPRPATAPAAVQDAPATAQGPTPTLPIDPSVFNHMADSPTLNGAPVNTNAGPAAATRAVTDGAAAVDGATEQEAPPPSVADYGTTLDRQLIASIAQNRVTRGSLDEARANNGANAGELQEQLNGDRRGLLDQLTERSGVFNQEIAAIDQQLGGRIPKNPTAEQQQLIARRQQLVSDRDRFKDQQTSLQRWSDRNEINDINTRLQDQSLTQEQRNELLTRKRTLATGLLSTVKLYQQFDPRWGNTTYGRGRGFSNMTEAGCGPTSLAMAMDFQDQEDPEGRHSRGEHDYYTPRRMADYAENHGRVRGSGTAGATMMGDLNGSFANVQGNTLNNRADATESLNNGIPVVIVGRNIGGSNAQGQAVPAYGGHFMVLTGVSEDGQNFNVHDGGRRRERAISRMTRQQLGAAYGMWNVTGSDQNAQGAPE
jgi:hypothetical protein